MKSNLHLLLFACLFFTFQTATAQIDLADCGTTFAADLVEPSPASCMTGPLGAAPSCADAGMVTEYFITDCGDIITTLDDPETPDVDESTSGPKILGSSPTGIVTPEDFGLLDGSCMGVVPVCYDLSAVQALVDAMNDGATACCALVNGAQDGVCTNIIAVYSSGDQVQNLDDLLVVFAAFGTTELSIEYFASVADGVNVNFDGGTFSLDNFCTGASAIAYCTDQDVGTEYNILPCSALGIELNNLDGENTTRGNELVWSTSTENNNDYFMVEKSTDGVNYSEIGQVKGAGNSAVSNEYAFNDNKVSGAINYYRLVSVSYAYQREISNVVAIKTVSTSVLDAVNITPNPVRTSLTLNFNSNIIGQSEIMIVDGTGKKVMDFVVDVNQGYNEIQREMSELNEGLFMAIVQIDDQIAVEKFLKL